MSAEMRGNKLCVERLLHCTKRPLPPVRCDLLLTCSDLIYEYYIYKIRDGKRKRESWRKI